MFVMHTNWRRHLLLFGVLNALIAIAVVIPLIIVQVREHAAIDYLRRNGFQVSTEDRASDWVKTHVAGRIHTFLNRAYDVSTADAKVTDDVASHLGQLTELRSLGLGGARVTDRQIERLGGLEKLQLLILGGTRVSDHGFEHLRHLKDLRMIDVSDTDMTDVGLGYFAECINLDTVDCSGTRICGDAFGALLKHGKLRVLLANDTPFHDKALINCQQNATSLVLLSLARSEITDVGMESIARMPNITRLNISGTRLSDIGFRQITKMRRLQALDASETRITDQSLKNIEELYDLRWIALSNTGVTESCIDDLRRTMPGLTVVWRGE